jgi:hypothetical protein
MLWLRTMTALEEPMRLKVSLTLSCSTDSKSTHKTQSTGQSNLYRTICCRVRSNVNHYMIFVEMEDLCRLHYFPVDRDGLLEFTSSGEFL